MIWLSLLACGIMNRTLDADNVILTYEWFFDAYQNIEARHLQIFDTEQQLQEIGEVKTVRAADAHDRLTVELQGQKQSCRDLVAEYNANAMKANRDLFRSNALPDRIDFIVCEGGEK